MELYDLADPHLRLRGTLYVELEESQKPVTVWSPHLHEYGAGHDKEEAVAAFHGSGQLDGKIPDFIRQQMKLNEAQFADLIACPLDRPKYITILKAKGLIRTPRRSRAVRSRPGPGRPVPARHRAADPTSRTLFPDRLK